MDYKYIEQLMERYWNCETTLEEEQILRTFFAQAEIPAHLLKYRSLFVYQREQQKVECLGEAFDAKVFAALHAPVVKAERLTLLSRFSGLWKAAAAVAVLCLLTGVARQMYPTASPHVAGYEEVNSADDPQLAARPAETDKQVSMLDSLKADKKQTAVEKSVVVE